MPTPRKRPSAYHAGRSAQQHRTGSHAAHSASQETAEPTGQPEIETEKGKHSPGMQYRARMQRKRPVPNEAVSTAYGTLTPRLMFQLAAPQTWAATIAAITFSFAYAQVAYSGHMSVLMALVLFLICALMQSAANVFNDYYDYVKGTDTLENSSSDAFDAVLVYNNINPKHVLAYGVALLVAAAACGAYVIVTMGWIPLVIGLIGALTVVVYSAGKTPISYLPIGEVISGVVMGALIPLACCYSLAGVLDPFVFVASLPIIIGIGMILATNNTCDIEKDSETERKTLALMLGRESAVKLYRAMVVVWLLSVVIVTGIYYTAGLFFVLVMLVALFPQVRAVFKNPFNAKTRDASMPLITGMNIMVAAFYGLAMLSNSVVVWM